MSDIHDHWHQIQRNVRAACERSGRSPLDVQVIAVTKTIDVGRIREVVAAGALHLGENKVQEALTKVEEIGPGPTWHFIGHLQSNKAKDVIGKFGFIHSLDRASLAQELDKRADAKGLTVDCLLEVNVAREPSKGGLDPLTVVDFCRELRQYPHIRVQGLMTVAPNVKNPEEVRPVFAALRRLREELSSQGWDYAPVPYLSMGMSNDYGVAIEEGAHFIRIGTAIFGVRSTNQS